MSSVSESKGAAKPPCLEVTAIVPGAMARAHHIGITFPAGAPPPRLQSRTDGPPMPDPSRRSVHPVAPVDLSEPGTRWDERLLDDVLEPPEGGSDVSLQEAGDGRTVLGRAVRLDLRLESHQSPVETERTEENRGR